MNKISLLPENLVNKIAAGEVIERPASVVKELVENSIDAGSSKIEISFEGDGTRLIKIVDNGCGMSRDDALLCLERHATSKIKELYDIGHIETLGFRGEAISSIAAVSKLELVSKEMGSGESGVQVLVNGGKICAVKDIGVPIGTKVGIKNLFFNTPARKKFLKTQPTEARHIIEFVQLISLSYPHIHFKLIVDNKIVLDAPKTSQIEQRVKALYGGTIAGELIPFSLKGEDFSLHGLLSKPSFTRGNRKYQHIFVNRRVVQNRGIFYGIKQGYDRLIPAGRFPVAIVFVDIEPSLVDVNIHPTKKEVKFVSERQISDSLSKIIQKTLSKKNVIPSMLLSEEKDFRDNMKYGGSKAVDGNELAYSLDKISGAQEKECIFSEIKDNDYAVVPETLKIKLEKSKYKRVIGQLSKSYILIENNEGLLILDQHAAHERVLFEKVKEKYLKDEVPSQKLLFPYTLELSAKDVSLLLNNLEILRKIGFELSQFAQDAVIIENIPAFTLNLDISSLIIDIISDIQEERYNRSLKQEVEQKIIRRCCRKAVMAHDYMSKEEMERLLEDIFVFNIPFSCPHGRPIAVQITLGEMEKKFKR